MSAAIHYHTITAALRPATSVSMKASDRVIEVTYLGWMLTFESYKMLDKLNESVAGTGRTVQVQHTRMRHVPTTHTYE